MLDHHIQRSILYALAFVDHMRFSELKPDDLDNKLFTYHLKRVISEGFVTKSEDGFYSLTPEGRRVGKGALKKQSRLINRAYSIYFMIIRRQSDGAWLLFKRGTQPLFGWTGFMHAQPIASEDAIVTAHRHTLETTGLDGVFKVASSGFFRIYKEDELESFTHFTLLVCEDISGDLVQNDELGEYQWVTDPDFSKSTTLPTLGPLVDAYQRDAPFIEKTFQV